jgi:hypothetical protein
MIGYLLAFAIGALASFAPALYNLLGGGQQQATNAALGNPSAATVVSVITIVGVIMLIVGLITFKGSQMVIGVILIIFAPQIAGLILNPPTIPTVTTTTPYPYYPPNPTTPYPTYPTTPSQTDRCLLDPLNLCPEQLESIWTDISLRVGEYSSSPLGFGARPNEGVFILIKTDRGWYWGGAQLQSVLTLATTGVPTIDTIYIYLLGYNPGDSLYLTYWVDLKETSGFPANQYRILDVEYQEIKVNNKIQLVAVLKPGTGLDLSKFDYNKEYYMTITVKPIPKISFLRGDVYFMYNVKVKKIASSSETTVSTVSSQNPFAYIYSTLQMAPPEYDINTGVNLQVLSAVISLAGLLVSIYTLNKMKGKCR